MDTNKISRQQVRGDLLKKIIIRIDYSGVPSITEWIASFTKDDELSCKFEEYDKGTAINRATFSFSNLKDIAKTLAIPLEELQGETIHRFSSSKFEGHEDKIVLDVTSFFTTMTIDCKNYVGIDEYLSYVVTYLHKLKEFCKYMKIARVGIRKIGGSVFHNVGEIENVYNCNLFFGEIIDEISSTAHDIDYQDNFIEKEANIKVNYRRLCREVEDSNRNQLYQVLMDIDGYIDEQMILEQHLTLPEKIGEAMAKINDCLFKLFVFSMNEGYLREKLSYGE